MKSHRIVALGAVAALLAGCSFQNQYEREATRVTEAVMKNDLQPVQNDIATGISIPRVQVAEWADELDAQGKLLSLKETTAHCAPGAHCFTVRFQKGNYLEMMRLDEKGKIVYWHFKRVASGAAAQ